MPAHRHEEARAKAIEVLASAPEGTRGLVTAAARVSGMARTHLSTMARNDPEFRQAVEDRRRALAAERAKAGTPGAQEGTAPAAACLPSPEQVDQALRGTFGVLGRVMEQAFQRGDHEKAARAAGRLGALALALCRELRERGQAETAAPAVATPPRLKALAGGWV